jgi:RNA polymerase sigma factor for flagellar operon FliA
MSGERLNEYQNHLVKTHVKLAQLEGLKAWRKAPDAMEKYEVVGIAYQGLVTAALRFDPEWRPANDPNYDPFLAFGSFARRRITGAIMDWQKARDHVPRNHRRIYKDLQKKGYDSGKSAEELADLTGLDVNKIRAVIQAVETQMLTLDADEDHWNDSPEGGVPTSPDDVEGSAMVSQITNQVADAIQQLPDIQRSVIVLRYYSGLDLSNIAMELGVSMSVVRIAHREAVDLLHDLMRRIAS